MKVTSPDARRTAGERTRTRLLDVTKSLIAEHGEAGVSLRDITDAAEANIASVSYHYGSKESLCRAAIDDAIDQVASAHMRALTALPANAGIHEISEALVSTIVSRKMSADVRERALLSISARALLAGPDLTSPTDVSRHIRRVPFYTSAIRGAATEAG